MDVLGLLTQLELQMSGGASGLPFPLEVYLQCDLSPWTCPPQGTDSTVTVCLFRIVLIDAEAIHCFLFIQPPIMLEDQTQKTSLAIFKSCQRM